MKTKEYLITSIVLPIIVGVTLLIFEESVFENAAIQKEVSTISSNTSKPEPAPEMATVPAIKPKATSVVSKSPKKIDISYIRKVNELAYSKSGLNLTSAAASEFSEIWLRKHSDISFSELRDVASYAYSSSGMNLTSAKAKDFTLLWFSEFMGYDFKDFKALYKSSYSSPGLNLTTAKALEYSLNVFRNYGS